MKSIDDIVNEWKLKTILTDAVDTGPKRAERSPSPDLTAREKKPRPEISAPEEIVSVNEDALDALALKKAKNTMISVDWATRKQEGGDGFEESEMERLKKDVEEYKYKLYAAALSLKLAEHFVANPPPPPID
jgi:hypothetical protein